jgi:hypothetical protein
MLLGASDCGRQLLEQGVVYRARLTRADLWCLREGAGF